MRLQLLHSERDALPLFVVVQHLDFDVIADRQHVGRMSHATPRDVGDVKQPVQSTQIDESAEVGNVLDRPFPDLTDLERLKDLLAQPLALFFQDHPAGDDDIPTILVQLDDAEREHLADELVEVLDLFDIDLRPRQERIDAEEVDHDTALDASHQPPFDHLIAVVSLLDTIPDPHEIGFGLGKDDLTFLVFDRLQKDLDLETRHDVFGIGELIDRDRPLRFKPDVDHNRAVVDVQHSPFDDLALLDVRHRVLIEAHQIVELRIGVLQLVERLEGFFRGRQSRLIGSHRFFRHPF